MCGAGRVVDSGPKLSSSTSAGNFVVAKSSPINGASPKHSAVNLYQSKNTTPVSTHHMHPKFKEQKQKTGKPDRPGGKYVANPEAQER